MQRTVAIVPVKASPTAKRRLAHVVGPRERERLVRMLFGHVTSVLHDAGLEVVAISSGPPPEADVETWPEATSGLNAALTAALRRIAGTVLIVPADLPWLRVADVDRLLSEEGDVVVVRARDGGTNALLMRSRIVPSFGLRSALAHAAEARAAGLRARVVELAGFNDDVDDEATLVRAGNSSGGPGEAGRRGHMTPAS